MRKELPVSVYTGIAADQGLLLWAKSYMTVLPWAKGMASHALRDTGIDILPRAEGYCRGPRAFAVPVSKRLLPWTKK